jgi:hypothetical protein
VQARIVKAEQQLALQEAGTAAYVNIGIQEDGGTTGGQLPPPSASRIQALEAELKSRVVVMARFMDKHGYFQSKAVCSALLLSHSAMANLYFCVTASASVIHLTRRPATAVWLGAFDARQAHCLLRCRAAYPSLHKQLPCNGASSDASTGVGLWLLNACFTGQSPASLFSCPLCCVKSVSRGTGAHSPEP